MQGAPAGATYVAPVTEGGGGAAVGGEAGSVSGGVGDNNVVDGGEAAGISVDQAADEAGAGLPLWQGLGIALGACVGVVMIALLCNLLIQRARGHARSTLVAKPNERGAERENEAARLATGVASTAGANNSRSGGKAVGQASGAATSRPKARGGAAAAAAAAGTTSAWEALVTDGGDVYYWNRQTDETSWQLPEGVSVTPVAAGGAGQLMTQRL